MDATTAGRAVVYYYAEPCGQSGARDEPRPPEWELFDLERDPRELHSVYHEPRYADVARQLTEELRRLQTDLGDTDCCPVPDRTRTVSHVPPATA